MEQALLSRQDLAKRWGFSDTRVLINYEQSGILKRVPKIPVPRYSLRQIEEIESVGIDINPLSPIERRRLERELEQVKKERDFYKSKIDNIKAAIS